MSVKIPKPESITESNLVEMMKLAFRNQSEINDRSVHRDVDLRSEIREMRADMNHGFEMNTKTVETALSKQTELLQTIADNMKKG